MSELGEWAKAIGNLISSGGTRTHDKGEEKGQNSRNNSSKDDDSSWDERYSHGYDSNDDD